MYNIHRSLFPSAVAPTLGFPQTTERCSAVPLALRRISHEPQHSVSGPVTGIAVQHVGLFVLCRLHIAHVPLQDFLVHADPCPYGINLLLPTP